MLGSRTTPEEIVLTVEDNGTGMSEELQAQVFTRFYSSKGAAGTGLGLSIVKHVTEGLGGQVMLESLPGKGSRFRVRLPLHAAAETEESSR